jgi:hypothetical protein
MYCLHNLQATLSKRTYLLLFEKLLDFYKLKYSKTINLYTITSDHTGYTEPISISFDEVCESNNLDKLIIAKFVCLSEKNIDYESVKGIFVKVSAKIIGLYSCYFGKYMSITLPFKMTDIGHGMYYDDLTIITYDILESYDNYIRYYCDNNSYHRTIFTIIKNPFILFNNGYDKPIIEALNKHNFECLYKVFYVKEYFKEFLVNDIIMVIISDIYRLYYILWSS